MEKHWQDIPDEIWQKLWEQAVPIDTAISAQADERTRTRYRRLKALGGPEAVNRNLGRALEELNSSGKQSGASPGTSFADIVASITESAPKRRDEFNALHLKLQALLLKRLRTGELIALSFADPRRPEDTPYPVPKDALSGSINWKRGRIRHESLKLEQVRISRPEWLDALVEKSGISGNSDPNHSINSGSNPGAAKDVRRALGRPSRKNQILEAHETLHRQGMFSPDDLESWKFDEIRKWIKERYPDPSSHHDGLSNETIRRVIAMSTQNTK